MRSGACERIKRAIVTLLSPPLRRRVCLQAFTRKRNMQLMRLDATWAVMWLIFQCAGISKVGHFADCSAADDDAMPTVECVSWHVVLQHTASLSLRSVQRQRAAQLSPVGDRHPDCLGCVDAAAPPPHPLQVRSPGGVRWCRRELSPACLGVNSALCVLLFSRCCVQAAWPDLIDCCVGLVLPQAPASLFSLSHCDVARCRTHWYARNRNWVMCALKLCRTLMGGSLPPPAPPARGLAARVSLCLDWGTRRKHCHPACPALPFPQC